MPQPVSLGRHQRGVLHAASSHSLGDVITDAALGAGGAVGEAGEKPQPASTALVVEDVMRYLHIRNRSQPDPVTTVHDCDNTPALRHQLRRAFDSLHKDVSKQLRRHVHRNVLVMYVCNGGVPFLPPFLPLLVFARLTDILCWLSPSSSLGFTVSAAQRHGISAPDGRLSRVAVRTCPCTAPPSTPSALCVWVSTQHPCVDIVVGCGAISVGVCCQETRLETIPGSPLHMPVDSPEETLPASGATKEAARLVDQASALLAQSSFRSVTSVDSGGLMAALRGDRQTAGGAQHRSTSMSAAATNSGAAFHAGGEDDTTDGASRLSTARTGGDDATLVAGAIAPPRLRGLVERLAKDMHEHWAHTRFKNGWRFAPTPAAAHAGQDRKLTDLGVEDGEAIAYVHACATHTMCSCLCCSCLCLCMYGCSVLRGLCCAVGAPWCACEAHVAFGCEGIHSPVRAPATLREQ